MDSPILVVYVDEAQRKVKVENFEMCERGSRSSKREDCHEWVATMTSPQGERLLPCSAHSGFLSEGDSRHNLDYAFVVESRGCAIYYSDGSCFDTCRARGVNSVTGSAYRETLPIPAGIDDAPDSWEDAYSETGSVALTGPGKVDMKEVETEVTNFLELLDQIKKKRVELLKVTQEFDMINIQQRRLGAEPIYVAAMKNLQTKEDELTIATGEADLRRLEGADRARHLARAVKNLADAKAKLESWQTSGKRCEMQIRLDTIAVRRFRLISEVAQSESGLRQSAVPAFYLMYNAWKAETDSRLRDDLRVRLAMFAIHIPELEWESVYTERRLKIEADMRSQRDLKARSMAGASATRARRSQVVIGVDGELSTLAEGTVLLSVMPSMGPAQVRTPPRAAAAAAPPSRRSRFV